MPYFINGKLNHVYKETSGKYWIFYNNLKLNKILIQNYYSEFFD